MNDFLIRVCGLAIVLATGVLPSNGSEVQAAPVALRFAGEIVEIRKSGNPLFDLPTDIAIGRPASLELTFEPIPFPNAATQGREIPETRLQLTLGSISLQDPNAALFVTHDLFRPRTGTSGGGVLGQENIGVRGVGIIPGKTLLSWVTSGGFSKRQITGTRIFSSSSVHPRRLSPTSKLKPS